MESQGLLTGSGRRGSLSSLEAILLSDQELMKIHVEALFTHDANRRLRDINEPGGAPAPRFFLGRTAVGNIWRFRYDVPEALVEQLEILCADEPLTRDLRAKPKHYEAYIRLLQTDATVQRVWMGPAYRVRVEPRPPAHVVRITHENAELLRFGFAGLITELTDNQPFLAVVREGRAVSVCRSVRITSEAHEAGVETLSAFRGRGYASEVAAGWATAVQAMGRLPLYSTSWENTASQGVARKLAMALYGADFEVT
jgi:RimJ/RimL family protein N-acetyltransferase